MNAPWLPAHGAFYVWEDAMRIAVAALSALVFSSSFAAAQTPYQLNPDADRVQQHYRRGWEAFLAEDWEEANREFKKVIEIDATHKLAYYGLGRSYMGLKQFGDAASAYEHCRDLYEQEASEKFTSREEADRIRQTDLDQIKTALNTLSARSDTGRSTAVTQNQIRILRDQAQRIQNKRDALNNNVDLSAQAPAFVSLALGAAYFRGERFADAERAYKKSLDADPKEGEAWNNLAVLYLFTNRIVEADRALTTAEKTGFKVNPALKDDINKRLKKLGG
jgi:tetratricopeptide (TPR) repeat protein